MIMVMNSNQSKLFNEKNNNTDNKNDNSPGFVKANENPVEKKAFFVFVCPVHKLRLQISQHDHKIERGTFGQNLLPIAH